MRLVDLTGRQFGRLTVLKRLPSVNKRTFWLCRCICEVEKRVDARVLVDGSVVSCGCKRRESHEAYNKTHGMSYSVEYSRWIGMVRRCTDPSYTKYDRWGGRGIRVCQGWAKSFESFYSDLGSPPLMEFRLERLDNNCHYSCGHCEECIENAWPLNVAWRTQKEQNRNKRNNRFVVYDGRVQCAAAWAEEYGIHPSTFRGRLDRGWSVEKALGVYL